MPTVLNKDTAGKAERVKPEPNSQRAELFPARIANKGLEG